MARSGPSYPHRFFAAAAYAGFGSPRSSSRSPPQFTHESAAILYALYQQATVGPCKVPRPSTQIALDHDKWKSWNALANMPSLEAMRLFVKILEEEDPAWMTKMEDTEPEVKEPLDSIVQNQAHFEDIKHLESRIIVDTEDKDVLVESISTIAMENKWASAHVSGHKPSSRYQHAGAIFEDKFYIIGGNRNGRYLNDVQVLDLKTLTWSKVEQKSVMPSTTSNGISEASWLPPCANHSLVVWGNKLLVIGGHSKDPSDTVMVYAFDISSYSWSSMKTFGKAPIARGGQSVTLVGSNLVMFGGQDSKHHLLNDLNILDLETMTWDAVEPIGTSPSPRSDHSATVHAGRYLFVFGGGSHSTCFNDLHMLDLDSMEWSQPQVKGTSPKPRAGHAAVTIGENWYIVGGGDNISGVSETACLNMDTLSWSLMTSEENKTSVAREGLCVVSAICNGGQVLIAFGGYNGHYNNEVYVMKTSEKAKDKSKHSGNSRDVIQENGVKEIAVDDPKSRHPGDASGDLSATISALQSENDILKHEISAVQASNVELSSELHSVRTQLDNEQSRCFRLEVDLAELRQKLNSMETLQKELDLLQRQKASADEAAAAATAAPPQQPSGGVWGWLAGAPNVKPSAT